MGDEQMPNFCTICGKELEGKRVLLCEECEQKVLFQTRMMGPGRFKPIDHSAYKRKEEKKNDR